MKNNICTIIYRMFNFVDFFGIFSCQGSARPLWIKKMYCSLLVLSQSVGSQNNEPPLVPATCRANPEHYSNERNASTICTP